MQTKQNDVAAADETENGWQALISAKQADGISANEMISIFKHYSFDDSIREISRLVKIWAKSPSERQTVTYFKTNQTRKIVVEPKTEGTYRVAVYKKQIRPL